MEYRSFAIQRMPIFCDEEVNMCESSRRVKFCYTDFKLKLEDDTSGFLGLELLQTRVQRSSAEVPKVTTSTAEEQCLNMAEKLDIMWGKNWIRATEQRTSSICLPCEKVCICRPGFESSRMSAMSTTSVPLEPLTKRKWFHGKIQN